MIPEGIMCPIITPCRDTEVDLDATEKLVRHILKSGVIGVFGAGSTGSFPILSEKEEFRFLDFLRGLIDSKHAFFADVSRNNYEDTLELGLKVLDIGPDAIVLNTPYYIPMRQDAIFAFFDRLLDKLDSDVMLYNIPQLSGNAIKADTLRKLADEHSNLVGIKESSGNFNNFMAFKDAMPNNFMVYQGQDNLLLPSLSYGAAGGICGTTNFIDLAVKVYKANANGKTKQAILLQKRLTKIKDAISEYPYPLGTAYLASKVVLGTDSTYVHFPIVDIRKSEKETLYEAYKEVSSF
ncbi:MAG: dihydrodipicolinate synthase family protein [Candidatus Micrarchaeaceae archaeon]